MSEFNAHGLYMVSNAGGYEIEISESGDAARVQDAFGSDNPETSDWIEIEYNEDGEPFINYDGYTIELSRVLAYIKIPA